MVDINFNKSYLSNTKIGKLNLDYGKIYKEDNQLVFKGKFNFNIKNEKQFFKTFQIPKNNRLKDKKYLSLILNLIYLIKNLKLALLKLMI